MALIGINQYQNDTPQDSTLDKVFKGVQIAQGVMGAALAIPKYIQDRNEFKARKAYMESQTANAPTAEERKAIAGIKTAETKAGIAEKFRPVQPGEAPEYDFGPEFGGAVKMRDGKGDIFGNEANKIAFTEALKQYDIAQQGETGAKEWSFGNAKVLLKPKGEDPEKRLNTIDAMRKEYTLHPVVKTFADQAQQFEKLKSAAGQKSAAGDVGLIYSFMKMMDPGSTVREGEFATAQQAGSVPDNIVNLYNKLVTGERVSVNRDQFVKTATDMFQKAADQYDGVKKFYKKLAQKRGYDDDEIIIPLSAIRQLKATPSGLESVPEIPNVNPNDINAELKRRGLM